MTPTPLPPAIAAAEEIAILGAYAFHALTQSDFFDAEGDLLPWFEDAAALAAAVATAAPRLDAADLPLLGTIECIASQRESVLTGRGSAYPGVEHGQDIREMAACIIDARIAETR